MRYKDRFFQDYWQQKKKEDNLIYGCFFIAVVMFLFVLAVNYA